jgi:hypothetical protein
MRILMVLLAISTTFKLPNRKKKFVNIRVHIQYTVNLLFYSLLKKFVSLSYYKLHKIRLPLHWLGMQPGGHACFAGCPLHYEAGVMR